MNEIVNMFLLVGDKFMPVTHLRPLKFMYTTCAPFSKNKKRIQNLKKQAIRDISIKTN